MCILVGDIVQNVSGKKVDPIADGPYGFRWKCQISSHNTLSIIISQQIFSPTFASMRIWSTCSGMG